VTLWDAVGPRSTAVALGNDGTAQITIPWPQAGNVTLYAEYSGDANYGASASAPPLAFSVSKGTPVVTLSAPSAANANQEVSVNVSVAGIPGNVALAYPTGVVEFWDSLNGGAAQLITAQNLTVGAGNISVFRDTQGIRSGVHSLKAHYRGDNKLAGGGLDEPTDDDGRLQRERIAEPGGVCGRQRGDGDGDDHGVGRLYGNDQFDVPRRDDSFAPRDTRARFLRRASRLPRGKPRRQRNCN